VALGHTGLAYLGGPSGSWAAGERRNAVRRSGRASGLQVVEFTVAEPTFEAAAAVVPQVLGSGASAVLAFNDQMALGVLAGVTNGGIRVPDDISIVGFDDVPMAAMVAPPLTTIGVPTGDVGAVAVAMLDEAPATKELYGELVVRHSTGRARRRRASAGAGRGRPSSAAGPG
jgi:LacI family transcriptional regulator